ncbi:hypothetical protein Dimus_016269, partial [Dionaea muscipula]
IAQNPHYCSFSSIVENFISDQEGRDDRPGQTQTKSHHHLLATAVADHRWRPPPTPLPEPTTTKEEPTRLLVTTGKESSNTPSPSTEL